MKPTTISLRGINLIKEFEGFKSRPYICPAGIITLGIGTTRYPDGRRISLNDPEITIEEAITFLRFELVNIEKEVDSFTRDDITQNQFDALVSFCPMPDAKILMKDLRWKTAGDIEINDEIIGIEEFGEINNTLNKHKMKRLKFGIVEEKAFSNSNRVKVITDKGDIIVSDDHMFLMKRISSHFATTYYWEKAKNLKFQDEIKYLPVWETDNSWIVGWLAGIFDGEGCLTRVGITDQTLQLSFVQNEGIVLDEVKKQIAKFQFPFKEYCRGAKYKGKQISLSTASEIFRFLGSIRPMRLLEKFYTLLEISNGSTLKTFTNAQVLTTETYENGEIVGIKTSIGTLICDGFVSHNCYNCGHNALRKSTLMKKVNKSPNDPTIRREFMKWIYANGKPLKGLVRRRKAEADLYFEDII